MHSSAADMRQGPPCVAARVRCVGPRCAVVLICAVAVAGCSSTSTKATPGPASGTTGVTATTGTPGSSTPPSAGSSAERTSSGPPNASGTVPACTTAQLRLGEGSSNGAGGTNYITYPLTNTGATACTMFGYPGVSVIDSSGAIVQQAARRNPILTPSTAPTGVLTVAAHASVYFVVSAVDTDPDPQRTGVRTGPRLRVYPPNQTSALVQSLSPGYEACRLAVGRVFGK